MKRYNLFRILLTVIVSLSFCHQLSAMTSAERRKALKESERIKILGYRPPKKIDTTFDFHIRPKVIRFRKIGKLPGSDLFKKKYRPKKFTRTVWISPRSKSQRKRPVVKNIQGKRRKPEDLTEKSVNRIATTETFFASINDPPAGIKQAEKYRAILLLRYDLNQNKSLDKVEAQVLLSARQRHISELLELFDKNDNRALDFDEVKTAEEVTKIPILPWSREEAEQFYLIDENRNNVIEQKELHVVAMELVPEAIWGDLAAGSMQVRDLILFYESKGKFSPEEIQKAKAKEFLERFDVNRNAELEPSEKEFFQMEAAFFKTHVIPIFDDDNNNILDTGEAGEAVRLLDKIIAHEKSLRATFVKTIMARIDKNTDGVICPDEAGFLEVLFLSPDEMRKITPVNSSEKLVNSLDRNK